MLNVDILGIIVYMWKRNDFETILTSNDVLNIQDTPGKRFGSIEIPYYLGLNAYFGPRIPNRPYSTPNYWPS